MKSAAYNQFLPWILPFFLLVVWQDLSCAGLLASRVLPLRVAVVIAGVHLTRTGELPMHLFESFRRAATGLMIGLVLGLRIREYVGLGVDSFIFSGYPHLEEAYRVD